jgi:hypothetical protein
MTYVLPIREFGRTERGPRPDIAFAEILVSSGRISEVELRSISDNEVVEQVMRKRLVTVGYHGSAKRPGKSKPGSLWSPGILWTL